MRNIVLIIIAVALGLVVGVAAMHRVHAGRVAELAREAEDQNAGMLAERDAALAEKARLEQENARLRRDRNALEEQLAQARATELEETEPVDRGDVRLDGPSMDALLTGLFENIEDPRPEPDDERPGRRRFTPEEAEARGRAMGERVRGYLEERFDLAQDPAEREVLGALMEYTDYLSDLRARMAAAEGDEERDAVRGEFFGAMRDMRGMMRDHRDGKLTDLANRYGIENPGDQSRFLNEIREVLADPLVNPGGMRGGMGGTMGGGRGGGFGGGPGGPGWQGRGRPD